MMEQRNREKIENERKKYLSETSKCPVTTWGNA